MPSRQELDALALICEAPVIQLFKRNSSLRPVDLVQLLTAYDKKTYEIDDVTMAADLIQKCLMWVPTDRISAFQATQHPFFAK